MSVLSRRSRTEESRRVTEAALVAATLALLGEGSAFADLGIEQIVKRAGLSRPTFYAYFADKRALVLHLGAALERDCLRVAEPWFAGADVSSRATIVAVMDAFTRHRDAVRAVTEAAAYDPEVAAFWRAFHARFLPGARRRISEGDPALAAEAVDARAYALVYMTERTVIEQIAHQLTRDEAMIDQLTWLWERAVEPAAAP